MVFSWCIMISWVFIFICCRLDVWLVGSKILAKTVRYIESYRVFFIGLEKIGVFLAYPLTLKKPIFYGKSFLVLHKKA